MWICSCMVDCLMELSVFMAATDGGRKEEPPPTLCISSQGKDKQLQPSSTGTFLSPNRIILDSCHVSDWIHSWRNTLQLKGAALTGAPKHGTRCAWAPAIFQTQKSSLQLCFSCFYFLWVSCYISCHCGWGMANVAYKSPQVDFLVRYNLLWLVGLLHKFIHAVLLQRPDTVWKWHWWGSSSFSLGFTFASCFQHSNWEAAIWKGSVCFLLYRSFSRQACKIGLPGTNSD